MTDRLLYLIQLEFSKVRQLNDKQLIAWAKREGIDLPKGNILGNKAVLSGLRDRWKASHEAAKKTGMTNDEFNARTHNKVAAQNVGDRLKDKMIRDEKMGGKIAAIKMAEQSKVPDKEFQKQRDITSAVATARDQSLKKHVDKKMKNMEEAANKKAVDRIKSTKGKPKQSGKKKDRSIGRKKNMNLGTVRAKHNEKNTQRLGVGLQVNADREYGKARAKGKSHKEALQQVNNKAEELVAKNTMINPDNRGKGHEKLTTTTPLTRPKMDNNKQRKQDKLDKAEKHKRDVEAAFNKRNAGQNKTPKATPKFTGGGGGGTSKGKSKSHLGRNVAIGAGAAALTAAGIWAYKRRQRKKREREEAERRLENK